MKFQKDGIIYSKIGRWNIKIPTILLLQTMGLTKKKIIYSLQKADSTFEIKKNILEKNTYNAISKTNILTKKSNNLR